MDNEQQTQPQVEQPVSTPMKKSVPTGVKVISILYYISFASALIIGIGLLVAGPSMGSLLGEQVPGGIFLDSGPIGFVLTVIGIVALVMSVLLFFIARGLWRGSNWARIIVIIISVLGLISAIMSLVSGAGGITNLIINGVIGGYLLFSKGVKEAFKKHPTLMQ